MDMKRFFLYAIVIAALALAGCGGNGGGGTGDMGMEMCPTGQVGTPPDCMAPTPTTSDVTVPTLPTGYASNPVGMFTVAAGGTMDNGDVTYSCPAGGAACEIEVMDDGTVTSTGGMATAARSSASMAQQTADEAAAGAAATKAAGTKATAIAAEGEQATDAGLGGSTDDGSAVDTYSLVISRDRMATTVKIEDSALAGDDDPKFTQQMDLGGGTTMHVREMDVDDNGNVVEEVVMVTTDIQAPRGVAFAEFEVVTVSADATTTTTTTPQELNAEADGTVDDTDAFVAFDPGPALISTDEGLAVILANINSPSFRAPVDGSASVTHTFLPAVDDADLTTPGPQPRAAAMVDGTYNGAMGMYTCSGTANCTATVDAMGMLTALSDGWIFTPAMGANSDQPDYDYLSYGFWLKKTTDKDGVLTYNEVETFARSSTELSGDLATVTGTATYSGGATGVYVKNVTTSTGAIESATSGHFTATANLTATFGQVPVSADDPTGTIAPNMLNTLTGTISDYQLAHGEANNWMTVLDGDITTADGTASGTAEGGRPGTDYDGSFSATFHGDTADDDDAPTVQPSSVVGEFNSFFTDGSVAGGFGARRQP